MRRSAPFIGLLGVLLLMEPAPTFAQSRLFSTGGGSGSSAHSTSNSATSQTTTTATTVTASTVQNSALAQRAQASLQRSLASLNAAQAAQAAARAAALNLPSTVPNGLNLGGLVPDSGLKAPGIANPVTTWVNAKTPIQTQVNGQTIVTVTQTNQQALLNWSTFNVGKTTTLNFDQSGGGSNAGNWVAINKVAPNVAPSQILGNVTAQGQVYVLNQNGIIFGGSSQVNVGSLVASSLPINTNLVSRGLLNNPDLQFLFSQVDQSAGTQGPTPAFTPQGTASSPGSAPAPGSYGSNGGTVAQVDSAGNLSFVTASGKDGDVVVQAGAQLTSPTTSSHVGGKIALVGPNVANAGTISTPDGQTILAAGNQVGFAAHNENDPSLRGLDVYVGAVDSTSGTASNPGLIDSPRADIMMVGAAVNQNGVINSSTSVSLNGRVDLLADYKSTVTIPSGSSTPVITPTASGTVTLGQGSLTEILPELSSTETAVGSQLALSSLVNIQGLKISFAQDALLLAPSASTPSDTTKPALGVGGVTLTSGVTLDAGSWLAYNGSNSFFNSTGQNAGEIDLAQGATIDVSGSQNVTASVSENIVSAQLLGTELANSPLQKDGPLRGQTVLIDLRQTGVNADGSVWVGTPLADVSGYVNLVQHTVGELTTSGGTVSLSAGGAVNLASGSTVNVSGGWINYQGGLVQTTKVVSGGQVIDISKAMPDLVYDGVYTGYTATSAKWGITQTYANSLVSGPQYQAGYIQGGSGGSLAITAPLMSVSGNLYGNTVSGANQRSSYSQLKSTYNSATFLPTVLATQAQPQASTLVLSFQAQNPDVSGYPTYSPTPAKIDFGTSRQVGDLVLTPDLINSNGFGNFTINNGDGSIFVPSDVSLTSSPGGSITFNAANIDIEGSLTAVGGTLSFSTYNYSPYADGNSPYTGDPLIDTPPVDPTRGKFQLGSGASLNVAGLVIDDRSISATAGTVPLFTSGGSVSINAFSANLATGSSINVSGGAEVSNTNKTTYGSGGAITIKAGQDPNLQSLVGGSLTLGSSLQGYSGAKGGSLTIQAPLIQIGGVAADPVNTLLLSPDFFSQGGFASFTLDGMGEVAPNQADSSLFLPGVSIAAGTTLQPKVQSWAASLTSNGIVLNTTTYSLASQRTPVSLNFDAIGVVNFGGSTVVRGDFVLGANTLIQTDPQGNVSLQGDTVQVLGKVVAPGGTISVVGAKNSSTLLYADQFNPLVTVDLAAGSLLSTAGVVLPTYNKYGFNTGSVLNGGSIKVTGNILAETGSVLDVSGTSGILDVAPTQTGGVNRVFAPAYVPQQVDSSGGSITLTGGQELVSAATIRGGAGGPSAQGGSLTVSSSRFDPTQGQVATTPLDITLDVTQGVLPYTASGLGQIVTVDGTMAALGYFNADSFNTSGLDSLTLSGTVQFSGPVTINANRSLTVGSSGIIYADDKVQLTAPYVKLGQAFLGPLTLAQQALPIFTDSESNAVAIAPSTGTGNITVTANSLIDVGNLSLQNIGNLNLVATGADIRGDGTLDVAGNISLTAGQIYPTTAATFTIAAHDQGGIAGSVTISASGSRQLPLSAGGTLNIYATDITQGGTLSAPIGTINLGSGVTSASPVDPLNGLAFDSTQNLKLTSGSLTSVSAVDPVTGQDLTIPYGTLLDGVSWIDPAQNNITVAGNSANAVPDKAINVSAVNVTDQAGATIDISGGGDIYAYRFVSGTGGTKDILASTTSFAIIPGYAANYAPYYSSSDYVNTSLAMGSQVYLSASSGLPAGVYTLLPARYALLPGAYLITQLSEAPPATATTQPDGSSVVSGYRFNGLDKTQTAAPLLASFEVDSPSVVHSRAEYDGYSANTFLKQSAATQGISVRLPVDAGQLVLAATKTMTLQGSVLSQTPSGGLGSQVDIASPSNILISGPNTDLSQVPANTLVLDSSALSAFGADSLLVGGYRTSTAAGDAVTVTTDQLTVDNNGTALTGPDVILASNQSLTLDAGADVEQSGTLSSSAGTLLLGNSTSAGSGDGILLRVSSDPSAQINRLGVDSTSGPSLSIGAGVKLSGSGLILDSTSATSLDSTASLSGDSVSINSGQISLVLDQSQPASGLVLSSDALNSLQSSARAVSLLSYSSIDLYEDGSGTIGSAADATGHYQVQSLALHAREIRGFDGGTVTINAQNVTLDNSAGGAVSSPVPSPVGGLVVNSGTLQIGGGSGSNTLSLEGYANVNLNASQGVLIAATTSAAKDSSGNPIQGSANLITSGNLQITTPLITGATAAHETITANGALTINASSTTASVTGGLGATLNLVGNTIVENSTIRLSSGSLSLNAQGDLTVGGTLDVGGTAQPYHDLTEYTSGGQLNLTSQTGSVILSSGSTVSVAANAGGGNAGSLAVSALAGQFINAGTINGRGGVSGQGGKFTLDVATLTGGNVQPLDSTLNADGFIQSISIRDRTDANVLVSGNVRASSYTLSADQGSITVNGTIDASNVAATDSLSHAILIGGTIDLEAAGSVTLASGATLTVAAQNFSNAGKGGAVTLAAGSETNGTFSTSAVVDIQAGSTIDLSVASATGASQTAGDFTGTLHLRAPQIADNSDLQINPVNGTILNASSIVVEGYALFDASADGSIDNQEANVYANGQTFAGNSAAILNRLFNPLTHSNSAALQAVTDIAPGAEIINTTGDLTLASDWDLSQFRFGPQNTAGILTLRAAGNLIFQGSLSDGFTDPTYTATLLTQNTALPLNAQSWTYHLVAGADFNAADFHQVLPITETYDPTTGLAIPGTASGSLELGNFVTQNNGNPISLNGETGTALDGYYQVIRTGTGDIDIATSGDVLLQNQFATIYTAGVALTDPTLSGAFDVPILQIGGTDYYPAQYSLAGGNVTISAQGNIAHVTQNNSGNVVLDSEKELPNNWLYRRGYVNTAGQFDATANGDIGSTSWWIDFSNFFEGVGALGGGNVTLTAGHDVSNVDAVAPTNARMTYQTTTGDTLAADQTLVEFGGGDVAVRAGNDINAGAYYVERGQGTLAAENSIVTNQTRSASLGAISLPASINNTQTWLPTTLFLGKGSFDVTAQNDLLLGPVANPFLLPQGVANTYWDKTYFSTYATTDSVNVAALTGNVTLRENATLTAASSSTPLLQIWLQAVDLLSTNPRSVSSYQPWLRTTETSVAPFAIVDAISPPTLDVTAFSGDLDVVGNLNLSPSPSGTLNLVVAGSINALQPNGVTNVINGIANQEAWISSTIDLSDADSTSIPGVTSPYAYQVVAGTFPAAALTTGGSIRVNGVAVPVRLTLSFISSLFGESGSTEGTFGVLQTKLKLHASVNGAPLHAAETNPVHLYAKNGDISGLTLFSSTDARIIAGQDITDIALYLQNNNPGDVSLVSAGRDLIAYDANSPLRVDALATGNALNLGSTTLAGDIQISGPGTLEVLAGRDLNLGAGPSNSDGTGVGISSIGNNRNPALPFAGADIIAMAGIGASAGLDASQLQFTNTSHTGFTDLFLDPATGGTEAARYLPDLGTLMGLPSSDSNAQIWAAFSQLPSEQQDGLALNIFDLVLRDAGRDHNASSDPAALSYAAGFAAIAALLPGNSWQGDLSLTSREIKTTNGGNINLLVPGGTVNVGVNVAGAEVADQGILTEDGGNISIVAKGDVNVGTSRIFTLHGGNEIIWSSVGNIDAGASSKTVQSAPPTRVLVDPQSGSVETDLAGLSTGGGIGVLETLAGVPPADVDLIAPNGIVNAGDAGIRVSGNLNIAAVQVLNAGNIQVGGKSSGVPTVSGPNIAGLSAASNAAGSATGAANDTTNAARNRAMAQASAQDIPSLITVEVLGYGGGDGDNLN